MAHKINNKKLARLFAAERQYFTPVTIGLGVAIFACAPTAQACLGWGGLVKGGASATTEALPGAALAVSAKSDYNGGDCSQRAQVRKVSGNCAVTGDGLASNGAGCGDVTANNTVTMDGALPKPAAPCVISYAAGAYCSGGGGGCGGWNQPSGTAQCSTSTQTIKFTPTINVSGAPAEAAINSSFTVTATESSTIPVTISTSGNCTNVGAVITMGATVAGVCTITYSTAADAAFVSGSTSSAVTGYIDSPIVVVSPAVGAAQAYLSSFTASATSSGAVSIEGSGVCSGTGTNSQSFTMSSGTGTCSVLFGKTTHMTARRVLRDVTATKLPQSITFPAQTTTSRIFVLNSTFAISPVATGGASGNAITYSSLNTGVCTVSGTTVTMKAAGDCLIAANQAGNLNYAAAPEAVQVVQLTKALQKIVVTTHAPGVKTGGQNFTVAAEARAVVGNALTGLPVVITGMGNCSGSGSNSATITMGSASGICTVLYSVAGDVTYEVGDSVTEYVAPDTSGGSGCFGEGTYTSLQFQNTGGYLGWACNAGDYSAPGHNVSCYPPIWWNVWPIYQPGWSIQPGAGFKGHVLQTQLNPGKSFQIKKAPGSGDYYNLLNLTDATCLAAGDAIYEIGGNRKGANASAGYLIAFQDADTLPSQYCDYTKDLVKWKMKITGSYMTLENQGYPDLGGRGCMGSDSSLALSRRLIAPGDGNYGHWGDSWVRNAAPSCNSGGAKIKCGGFTPPPPNHIRFEFDSRATYACQASVTIKVCNNAAPAIGAAGTCSPFVAYTELKPIASRGTWAGLTAAPRTGFTGNSSNLSLSHSTAGDAVSLAYSNVSTTALADPTLECYDTATDQRVSCTSAFIYKTCPSFDAVETGAALSTNLYTKLAGTAFSFDVVGAAAYTGNATVTLVDVSAAGSTACSGGTDLASTVFTAPSGSTGSNTYAYVAGDAGRKTFTARYDDAAAKVAVRIVDKTSTCHASSDTFAIRPAHFALATTLGGGTATAGADFTLTATAKNSANATTAAYLGTPSVDDSSIYGWDTNNVSGLLSGSFTSTVAGVATGTDFKFSGVGALDFVDYSTDARVMFSASSVGDTSFTEASEDEVKGDCIPNSFNTTLAGGKYGCSIGSKALSSPRFIPDHYEVNNKVQPSCLVDTDGNGSVDDGMTYFGQAFKLPPAAQIAAIGADGGVLSNLTSAYPSNKPTFTIEAINAGVTIASPATAAPVSMVLTTPFDWTSGMYTNVGTGSIPRPAIVRPAAPPNYETFALKTTVSDPDGVQITKCNGVTVAATASCTSSTTRLRFGMLKLDSAYGSELLPLYVPVTALYWNGSAWVRNALDTLNTTVSPALPCTSLAIKEDVSIPTKGSLAIGNYKSGLASGEIVVPDSALSLNAGRGSIKLGAPGAGNHGSADVALNLNPFATTSDSSCIVWGVGGLAPNVTNGADLSYLRGAWCGNTYANDPSARITFGTPKSQFLYMRERY